MKKYLSLILIFLFSLSYLFTHNACEKLDELTGSSSKPGKISGVVNDSLTGNAVPLAIITTIPPTSSTETDEDGAFLLEEIEKGDYNIKIVKADYNTKTVAVTVNADKTTILSIPLVPTNPPVGIIQGVIRNSQNNLPIANATITTEPATQTVLTDGDGKFSISNCVARTYTVKVSATGYQNGSNTVQVTAGAIVEVSISLDPIQTAQIGTIKGTVTNSATNAPIADADMLTIPSTKIVKTDANGNYELKDIPIGTYAVVGSKSGFNNATIPNVVLSNGETKTVNIQMNPSGSEKGALKVNANISYQGMSIPASEVSVTLIPGNYSKLTDTNGVAQFTDLTFGQYLIRCEHASLITVEQNVTISSTVLTEITIVMSLRQDLPGTIEGKVLDENSRTPIANVSIVFNTDNNRTTISNGGGEFTFSNVPVGQHSLTATAFDGIHQPKTIGVAVFSSQTSTAEIVMQTFSTAGRIFGTVLDNMGKPVPATIKITGQRSGTYNANSSGYYEIVNLAFGTYEMEVEAAGYVTQKRNTAVSASVQNVEVNFLLVPIPIGLTFITGKVVNVAKIGEPNVLVEISNPNLAVYTNGQGNFELKYNFAPGSYQLKISKPGFLTMYANATVAVAGDTIWIGEIIITPSGGANKVSVSGMAYSITSMKGIPNTTITTMPITTSALTSGDGAYQINNVDPGTYSFTLAHSTYINYTIPNVTIPNQSTFPLDLIMFYGKYTADQIGYYPMVSTWQQWTNNYWGSAGSLSNFGTTPTTNRFNNTDHARLFSGSSYLRTEVINEFSNPTVPAMVSCWVKIPSTLTEATPIIGMSNSLGAIGWGSEVEIESGKTKLIIYMNNRNGTSVEFGDGAADNILDQWAMLTIGVRQLPTGNFQSVVYVNGVKIMDEVKSFPDAAMPAMQLTIGRGKKGNQPYQFFSGIIDDVRIFNRFLPETDIMDLWNEDK